MENRSLEGLREVGTNVEVMCYKHEVRGEVGEEEIQQQLEHTAWD